MPHGQKHQNIKQKQYCNKLNKDFLKMVHIKKMFFFNFQRDFTLKARSVDSYKDEEKSHFLSLPPLPQEGMMGRGGLGWQSEDIYSHPASAVRPLCYLE